MHLPADVGGGFERHLPGARPGPARAGVAEAICEEIEGRHRRRARAARHRRRRRWFVKTTAACVRSSSAAPRIRDWTTASTWCLKMGRLRMHEHCGVGVVLARRPVPRSVRGIIMAAAVPHGDGAVTPDVLLAAAGGPTPATAGSGDVLLGIIGASGAGVCPRCRAVLAIAAHVHGRAASPRPGPGPGGGRPARPGGCVPVRVGGEG